MQRLWSILSSIKNSLQLIMTQMRTKKSKIFADISKAGNSSSWNCLIKWENQNNYCGTQCGSNVGPKVIRHTHLLSIVSFFLPSGNNFWGTISLTNIFGAFAWANSLKLTKSPIPNPIFVFNFFPSGFLCCYYFVVIIFLYSDFFRLFRHQRIYDTTHTWRFLWHTCTSTSRNWVFL